MLPLLAVGIVCLSSDERRLAHFKPTLEGMALVFAFTALVWFFILRPIYFESEASVLEKALSSAYPVGDLVLAYVLVVAVGRQWGFRDGEALTMLLVGLLLLIIGDVGFAYLTLQDAYGPYSLINLGWPLGFLFMGYAAALSAGWRLTFAEGPEKTAFRAWARIVPLAPVPPSLVLVFFALTNESTQTSVPLLIMTCLAGAAVFAYEAVQWGLLREVQRSRERLLVWIVGRSGRASG